MKKLAKIVNIMKILTVKKKKKKPHIEKTNASKTWD